MDTLAQRVAFLREASGREAAPLSRLCGLASSHLGMIERGKVTNLAQQTLRAIADATGAPLPWLAFGLGRAPDPASIRAQVDLLDPGGAASSPPPVGSTHTANDFGEPMSATQTEGA